MCSLVTCLYGLSECNTKGINVPVESGNQVFFHLSQPVAACAIFYMQIKVDLNRNVGT